MSTLEKKIKISLGSASLFFLLNLPKIFIILSEIFNLKLYENNCPTKLGLVFSTIIFFITTYFSMGDPFKNKMFKLKNTTYGTLIFYLISSPPIYYITNLILNRNDICPSSSIILLHSVVYCLALIGVMYFPE
jgi:hypothetical protein